MHLATVHIIFIILTTALVLGVGVYAGTRIKSAVADFQQGEAKLNIVSGGHHHGDLSRWIIYSRYSRTCL